MYADLIKRLRWTASNDDKPFDMETATLAAAALEQLQADLARVTAERDAAVEDMVHIATEIENCNYFLSDGEDRVKSLKLGRCDVCKGVCHEDEPCKFEWRGAGKEREQG